MRALWRSIVALLALVAPAPTPDGRPGCLIAPVQAPIVVRFRAPECPYCSGQRGIEYASAGPGALGVVRAAGSGVVTFSGVVVGTRYVVVAQADGLVATYGMLADTVLHDGDAVLAAATIGHVSAGLYFGLRWQGVYLDPVPLLGVVTIRHRLVPIDGRRARPARLGPPRCAVVAGTPARAR
ncbi:unannotated protein [freshwater metagenome]|uniref:Unannotated protein n=1 Tax=freshwater metagenome TaxID=449393 RepID=A0A6J7FRH6_9ZZZZ|nr:peptidoglycan DD-metalloendopeptidase family protein [Actinomycetota bacterium]